MGELSGFSWRVIDTIQKLIEQKGLTDAEVIARSGVPRNTFYRKMRGETPLNTNDIEAIADALGVDPFDLTRPAPNVTPLRSNVVGTPPEDHLKYAARPREIEPTDEQ